MHDRRQIARAQHLRDAQWNIFDACNLFHVGCRGACAIPEMLDERYGRWYLMPARRMGFAARAARADGGKDFLARIHVFARHNS